MARGKTNWNTNPSLYRAVTKLRTNLDYNISDMDKVLERPKITQMSLTYQAVNENGSNGAKISNSAAKKVLEYNGLDDKEEEDRIYTAKVTVYKAGAAAKGFPDDEIVAIPDMVAKDERYQNAMKNSDKQNARMESERALQQVIFSVMADNMELFKQFQDNPSFKKWLSDMVFNMTYDPKSGSKIIEYPQVETNASMVAESPTPYGAKKE